MRKVEWQRSRSMRDVTGDGMWLRDVRWSERSRCKLAELPIDDAASAVLPLSAVCQPSQDLSPPHSVTPSSSHAHPLQY